MREALLLEAVMREALLMIGSAGERINNLNLMELHQAWVLFEKDDNFYDVDWTDGSKQIYRDFALSMQKKVQKRIDRVSRLLDK